MTVFKILFRMMMMMMMMAMSLLPWTIHSFQMNPNIRQRHHISSILDRYKYPGSTIVNNNNNNNNISQRRNRPLLLLSSSLEDDTITSLSGWLDGLIPTGGGGEDDITLWTSSVVSPLLQSLRMTLSSSSSPLGTILTTFKGEEEWIGAATTGIALLLFWNGWWNPKQHDDDVDDDYRKGLEPYKRGEYDPIAARAFYRNRPILVIRRFCQLMTLYNSFLFHVALDKYVYRNNNDEAATRSKRANELLEVMQQAGPTSIKVGQALSVRPDLIAPEYAKALGSLQDRVPPFPSKQAFDIMNSEWTTKKSSSTNKNKNNNKIDISNKQQPVASASIGQVYKGTIMDQKNSGDVLEVAIKVQRPNVLAEIALDLYLVKEYLAPLYKLVTRSPTDFSSLANEWGRGFIYELDYQTEAMNTLKFNRDMIERNLDTVVIAPHVLTEYSTERILVTEWIDGERLDQSTAVGDVPRLCGVALNAYLVMLLETGTLHCDPHPGNLLRQKKDGKLVILDFGMTLETDPNLQYSLLEFVAHLTGDDYDKLPQDFVDIGFLKKERLETVVASGFLEPLTYMFQQAKQGGSGKKVRERIFDEYRDKFPGLDDDELRVAMRADMKEKMEIAGKEASAVSGITMEVEELQRRNRDAFSIPEWFLYTSRAFLTLEGISLQADEDYSIIQSCFPYVAKRLLNDDSPRAQKALKELLYGAGSALDSERIKDLADGFTTFSTTTSTTQNAIGGGGISITKQQQKKKQQQQQMDTSKQLAQTEATVTLAKESADILLSPEGNMVQSLFLQESTLATSAQVKDTLRTISSSAPIIGDFLSSGMAPFLRKTKEEEQAQNLLDSLLSGIIVNNNNNNNNNNSDKNNKREEPSLRNGGFNDLTPEQMALLAKEVRENLPKYGPLLGQLGGKFATALLDRASLNIEDTLATTKESDSVSDSVVRTAAKGLSTVASQGAEAIRNSNSNSRNEISNPSDSANNER